MRQDRSNIFNGSAVTYFGVPHSIVGDKFNSPLQEMSHNCIKLALVLYSKANRDQSPVVTFDRADIEERAGINKQYVVKTIHELKRFHIAQHRIRKRGVYTFTLLDPSSGKTLPSLNQTVKDGVLTEDDVLRLAKALGLGRMEDAQGSMCFICPSHLPMDSHRPPNSSRTKKGKHWHLNITHTPTGWVWQCTFPPCRLHGRRKTEVVKDSYGDYVKEVLVGGGGTIVDLVAAVMYENSGREHPVTQQEALEEMNRLLGRNSKDHEMAG